MKRIIVACGSGIATSGMVAFKINSMLQERGLSNKAKADSIDIRSIEQEIRTADIFVSITPNFDHSKYGKPAFNGVPFLTGAGADAIMDEIQKLL